MDLNFSFFKVLKMFTNQHLLYQILKINLADIESVSSAYLDTCDLIAWLVCFFVSPWLLYGYCSLFE